MSDHQRAVLEPPLEDHLPAETKHAFEVWRHQVVERELRKHDGPRFRGTVAGTKFLEADSP